MTSVSSIIDRSAPHDSGATARALEDARADLRKREERYDADQSNGGWRAVKDAQDLVQQCEVRHRAQLAKEVIAARRRETAELSAKRARRDALHADVSTDALTRLATHWTKEWTRFVLQGAELMAAHELVVADLRTKHRELTELSADLGIKPTDGSRIERMEYVSRFDAANASHDVTVRLSRPAHYFAASLRRALKE